MAIRNIVLFGDEVLKKKSRRVEVIDDRICALLDDMIETLHDKEGAGLAAPQVGVLKRVVVIDIGNGVMELINPEIVQTKGAVEDAEGCLSLPGKYGMVERPEQVTVKALNRKGEEVTYTGEGLLARAFCHEIDHLDGILYIEKMSHFIEEE